jgi:hypothetical protein
MTKKDNLENNRQDLTAAVGKSVVGAIPFAGPLLSEVIGAVIPNQRVDRLTKYIKILEDKMSQIPEEIIDRLKMDEHFIDLVEEGFVQASRAITDERSKYIASILANGITDDSIKLEESKSLLKILQELNDVEVIWLRFYQVPTIGGDEEFRKKFENVLSPIRAYIGANKETLQKAALQDSYKKHLERLGLIKNHILTDSETKIPEFDRFTGQPKISYLDITQLGKMLLEQIGMSEENE